MQLQPNCNLHPRGDFGNSRKPFVISNTWVLIASPLHRDHSTDKEQGVGKQSLQSKSEIQLATEVNENNARSAAPGRSRFSAGVKCSSNSDVTTKSHRDGGLDVGNGNWELENIAEHSLSACYDTENSKNEDDVTPERESPRILEEQAAEAEKCELLSGNDDDINRFRIHRRLCGRSARVVGSSR